MSNIESQVCEIANGLHASVLQLHGSEEYGAAMAHGASSSMIQKLVTPFLLSNGFVSEIKQSVGAAAFKPDFLLERREFSVLVEVERGKTLDNNMDMLDMWKCHVHPTARHLFLLVPVWYEKSGKKPSCTPTFSKVCKRLSLFFEPRNATNVQTLHVIGY